MAENERSKVFAALIEMFAVGEVFPINKSQRLVFNK